MHHPALFFPGVAGIAIGAAQIAATKPHKSAGKPNPSGLSLDRVKKL